ncbi:MAG: PmoA family protein [Pirellulales bacterium]|nr:PmoA family protein [Pirellulales bacterium]
MINLCLLLCHIAVVSPNIQLQQVDEANKVTVAIDGNEALAYQYSPDDPLPNYWPLRSPSGKLLTPQQPSHHRHHRSLWIADNVQGENLPAVDFYHCWKNYREKNKPKSGYRHLIRHQRFGELRAEANRAVIEAHLQWIVNETEPLLDDHRTLGVVALGQGEYLIDLQWKLTPARGEVRFLSDDVHYAWPYVCMHPQFSGARGGTITNDRGGRREQGTHGKVAKWVDYSNTVEGETEGLAVFVYPDGQEHRWLTREYGTFGPRRGDQWNGKPFTLKSGNSLVGRVGILVHRGDVESGHVAERYEQYIQGKL